MFQLFFRCWQREISERLTVKEIVFFFVEKSDCLLQGGKQASEKEVEKPARFVEDCIIFSFRFWLLKESKIITRPTRVWCPVNIFRI